MTFQVESDCNRIRSAGPTTRYLRVRLEAPSAAEGSDHGGADIALVVDRSSSMNGARLDAARHAVQIALEALRPVDRFSIVSYSDSPEVLSPLVAATDCARAEAWVEVMRLRASGGTDLAEGWLVGCAQLLAAEDAAGRPRRVILLTDGQANRGETDSEVLASRAATLRREGVTTSAIGLGLGFAEQLLAPLADRGGGGFWFAESPQDLVRIMPQELLDAVEVVWSDVRLTVAGPTGVQTAILMSGADEGRLPDLAADQTLEIPLEVVLPAGSEPCDIKVMLEVQGVPEHSAQVTFTRATDSEVLAAAMDPDVINAIARALFHRAVERAARRYRTAGRGDAKAELMEAAQEVLELACDNPGVRAIARDLRRRAEEFGRGLSERELKSRHFQSYSSQRSRRSDGSRVKGAY